MAADCDVDCQVAGIRSWKEGRIQAWQYTAMRRVTQNEASSIEGIVKDGDAVASYMRGRWRSMTCDQAPALEALCGGVTIS